jgi:DNA-directed RNA polymerase subunit RPC12/RpoP
MANFYCEYCGAKYSSVSSLTNLSCPRHPNGANKGKHKLYEGNEKSKYTCKYCGASYSSISSLTNLSCPRHPNGTNKGKHAPAL